MEHRHLIAYTVLLLLVLSLGGAWFIASRDRRHARRARRGFDRQQKQRRAATAAEEGR